MISQEKIKEALELLCERSRFYNLYEDTFELTDAVETVSAYLMEAEERLQRVETLQRREPLVQALLRDIELTNHHPVVGNSARAVRDFENDGRGTT